jgi:hypothetical protein
MSENEAVAPDSSGYAKWEWLSGPTNQIMDVLMYDHEENQWQVMKIVSMLRGDNRKEYCRLNFPFTSLQISFLRSTALSVLGTRFASASFSVGKITSDVFVLGRSSPAPGRIEYDWIR